MHRAGLAFLLCALLAACGGGKSSPSTPPGSPASNPTVNSPAVVNVSVGMTAAGVDITVPAPASSPPPNAQVLGVADLTGTATAFNTGATIRRGTTMRVLLFGPGLSGSMQVTIRGPADIQISNLQSITATDNTPGVSFTAAVSPSAALGSRTVVLQDSNGDVTTFTGGLEVVP